MNIVGSSEGASVEGATTENNVLYIREYEHCLNVNTNHKNMFGGVIDTGFNGVALASTKWLASYGNFLRK